MWTITNKGECFHERNFTVTVKWAEWNELKENEQLQMRQLIYQMIDKSEMHPRQMFAQYSSCWIPQSNSVIMSAGIKGTSHLKQSYNPPQASCYFSAGACCDWKCINHRAGRLSAVMTLLINTADRWPWHCTSSSAFPITDECWGRHPHPH